MTGRKEWRDAEDKRQAEQMREAKKDEAAEKPLDLLRARIDEAISLLGKTGIGVTWANTSTGMGGNTLQGLQMFRNTIRRVTERDKNSEMLEVFSKNYEQAAQDPNASSGIEASYALAYEALELYLDYKGIVSSSQLNKYISQLEVAKINLADRHNFDLNSLDSRLKQLKHPENKEMNSAKKTSENGTWKNLLNIQNLIDELVKVREQQSFLRTFTYQDLHNKLANVSSSLRATSTFGKLFGFSSTAGSQVKKMAKELKDDPNFKENTSSSNKYSRGGR